MQASELASSMDSLLHGPGIGLLTLFDGLTKIDMALIRSNNRLLSRLSSLSLAAGGVRSARPALALVFPGT